VKKVEEVVSVLAGGIEAHDELDRPVALGNAFESLSELAVTGGRFGKLKFVGGGLKIVTQEGGVVAVA